MHFVKSLFVGASVVVAAIAQSGGLSFTTVPTSVQAGTPTVLKWSGGGSSSVTITLKQGPSTNLKTIAIITDSAKGNSFTWTPPKTLANGEDYAFQISQGSEINYSGLFSLSGGSNAPESTLPAPSKTSASESKLSASSKTSASESKLSASSKTSASESKLSASSKTSASSKSTESVGSITSSLSSIISSISAVASSNKTHITTTVAPVNATTSILIGTGIGTGASSGGTGIPISRNTTLSHPTLKSTKTALTTSSGPASTKASSTGTSPSGSSTGKPNSAANLASPLAFIISAFVAIIYLG